MEPSINELGGRLEPLKKVTPLSKYLSMILFIALPFIGGWIGYTYAPEKVVEVERIVIVEKEDEPADSQVTQENLQMYKNEEFGFEMHMTKKWIENMRVKVGEPHLYGINISFELKSRDSGQYQVACNLSVSTQEEWNDWQKEEGGKSVYLASSTDLIFGYGCGHDDYGFIGFEEHDAAVDERRFNDINDGLVTGPYQEFSQSVQNTFKITQ